jgi:hypothetical protein
MFPKHQYIRSPKLMEAYRKIPCQRCGRDDGTVCGAHSNQGQHGKGKSIKADDNQAASLCHRCHTEIDQGSKLSEAERVVEWSKAQAKTFRELLARGLWPVDVPFPEIDTSLLGRYEG